MQALSFYWPFIKLGATDVWRHKTRSFLTMLGMVFGVGSVIAMLAVGETPVYVPIRGGTDGATISYMGMPCPNLPTGGANFHGVYEYVAVQSLERMVDVLEAIVVGKK